MGRNKIIITLAILCLGYICGHPSENPTIKTLQKNLHSNQPVQVCGPYLSTLISLVCAGNYNTMYQVEELRFPYKRREDANSMVRYRRRKRGVSDECCSKPCTHSELKTFCGAPT